MNNLKRFVVNLSLFSDWYWMFLLSDIVENWLLE